MKFLRFIFFSLIFFGSYSLIGQKAYSRIEAEITIKEIDSSSRITTGKMYFDKNLGAIYYSIKYPSREVIVYTDTMIYKLSEGKVLQNHKSTNGLKFNIFNLVLNSQMEYYGLNSSSYELIKTKKDKDQIITTWEPKFKNKKYRSGKIIMSQKNKLIFGLVSFHPDGSIISKQFFEDYINIEGLMIPSKITQIALFKEKPEYKITTYKNIKVNNFDDQQYYSSEFYFSD
jgi:hypothetical protein